MHARTKDKLCVVYCCRLPFVNYSVSNWIKPYSEVCRKGIARWLLPLSAEAVQQRKVWLLLRWRRERENIRRTEERKCERARWKCVCLRFNLNDSNAPWRQEGQRHEGSPFSHCHLLHFHLTFSLLHLICAQGESEQEMLNSMHRQR